MYLPTARLAYCHHHFCQVTTYFPTGQITSPSTSTVYIYHLHLHLPISACLPTSHGVIFQGRRRGAGGRRAITRRLRFEKGQELVQFFHVLAETARAVTLNRYPCATINGEGRKEGRSVGHIFAFYTDFFYCTTALPTPWPN